MDVRDQLRIGIRSWSSEINGNLRNDTPLISSGLLDSTALFNLMLWVEEQIGCQVDPTDLDVVEAWDTIDNVAAFVERNRRETQP